MIINLSKRLIINNLHSLIEKCETQSQVETLISLIDFISKTKENVPMKSIKWLMKGEK